MFPYHYPLGQKNYTSFPGLAAEEKHFHPGDWETFFCLFNVFIIAINSTQGWLVTVRHGIMRKKRQKELRQPIRKKPETKSHQVIMT